MAICWGLFAVFALLVILVAGSILTISLIKTSQLANHLSESLISSAQKQTDAELHNLFDPIAQEAAIGYRWVTAGLVKRYDTEALKTIFLPSIAQLPQCGSMMVSDMTGYEFLIMKNAMGNSETPTGVVQYFTRESRRDEWGKKGLWTLWGESGDKKVRQWNEDMVWTKEEVLNLRPSGTSPDEITEEDLIYDPRRRVWHKGPRDRYREWSMAEIAENPKGAVYWTGIDYFFVSKTAGITAGIAAKDPQGEIVVVAYDLLLGDISAFTRSLKPSKHGKVFVFTGSGKIIGLPQDERFQDKHLTAEMILKPVEDTGISELVTCMKYWRVRQSDKMLPFRFQSEGHIWWAGIRPFHISSEQTLWVAAMIPESDLIGVARQEQFIIVAVGFAALILAVILAWYLAHKFADPLQALTEQSKRIAALDMRAESHIVSRLSEVNQLSDSLEVMRNTLENYITNRKEAEKTVFDYQRRLKSLATELLLAEERERRRTAIYLHDHISQALALERIGIEGLRKAVGPVDDKVIDELSGRIKTVIESVQSLTFDLSSPTLYKFGLEKAVDELLDDLFRKTEINYKLSHSKPPIQLDNNLSVLLFRCIRELLVNIIKHARAKKVRVAILRDGDNVQITVNDDGIGFDFDQKELSMSRTGGFGLFNIQERISFIGGSFDIQSQPGKGSRLTLIVPIKTEMDLSKEISDAG